MFPRRIVAMGASSIYGRSDTEMGGFINRLKLWHESHHPRNFVYQLGVFGETTDKLIERVATEAPPRRPHLIAFYPGYNDIRREGSTDSPNAVPLESYRSLMKALVDRAKSIAPVLMLTGYPFIESKVTPYGDSDWNYLRSDAERYMGVLREVCHESEVMVLDYFTLWQGQELTSLLSEDGLHGSSAGHQLLFEQLRDFLEHTYL